MDIKEHMGYLQQSGFNGYSWEKKWETIKRLMQDSIDCHCWMALDYTGNPLLKGPVNRKAASPVLVATFGASQSVCSESTSACR